MLKKKWYLWEQSNNNDFVRKIVFQSFYSFRKNIQAGSSCSRDHRDSSLSSHLVTHSCFAILCSSHSDLDISYGTKKLPTSLSYDNRHQAAAPPKLSGPTSLQESIPKEKVNNKALSDCYLRYFILALFQYFSLHYVFSVHKYFSWVFCHMGQKSIVWCIGSVWS